MRYLSLLATVVLSIANLLFAQDPAGAKPSQAAQVVHIVGGPWPPISDRDPGSPYGWKGLFVDALEQIFVKELGCRIVFDDLPSKRAQAYLEAGESDVMITIPTEERLKYAYRSDDPVLKMYLQVYTYRNHPKLAQIRKIRTVEDILALDLVPVTNLGNGWHQQNIDAFGVKTHYVPSDENIPQFLAGRRADIMIDAVIPMNDTIRKLGLTSKLVLTDVKFGPVNFHLMLSRKSKFARLMPRINQVMHRLAQSGYFDNLAAKYSKQE